MLKIAESYILIQEMESDILWHEFCIIPDSVKWFKEIDGNYIYDMKHKEVIYYTNNYTAFSSVEIKLWQKLQISFSFGLTGSYE